MTIEALARDEELWQEASRLSIPTEPDGDLEQAILESTPYRVALALLAEPLRVYRQLTRQRPELMRQAIDNDNLDETLKVFAGLRNTIFHVPYGQEDFFEADTVMAHASTSHGDYLTIVAELVQFFQGFDVPASQRDH